jgi:hypothetical protein
MQQIEFIVAAGAFIQMQFKLLARKGSSLT